MTTRGGATLRADVYRPAAPGRYPVLLSRLPYDKSLRRRPGDIDVFVEHGYVVIMQDTRGRFASDGDEYYPLTWEAPDGYDAVEWAAELPYADGKVGTLGQSYLGATQYLLAPTRPPHLVASFPASAPGDFHECWVYHSGGAFELGWQIPYAILMARDTIARRGLTKTLWPELERDRHGRHRLRAGGAHRSPSDSASLVRLLAQGSRHRHSRRAACEDLRHGREPVAGRTRVAARPHALHALVSAQRRTGQQRGRRRHAGPRAAPGRARGPVRLRPERSGAPPG